MSGTMLYIIWGLLAYVIGSVCVYGLCCLVCKMRTDIGLGNGVKVKHFNLFLLLFFWPITIIMIVVGIIHDAIKYFKSL